MINNKCIEKKRAEYNRVATFEESIKKNLYLSAIKNRIFVVEVEGKIFYIQHTTRQILASTKTILHASFRLQKTKWKQFCDKPW